MIKEPSFTIDQELIVAQAKDYGKWLQTEWFDEQRNSTSFAAELRGTLEAECKAMSDVKQMLSVMDVLHFNSLFADLLKETAAVRHAVTICLHNIRNDGLNSSELFKLFKASGYPIGMIFPSPSPLSHMHTCAIHMYRKSIET